MIYNVKKQVFDSKGYPVETSFFTLPCASVDEAFGSFEAFKDAFSKAGATQFGLM